ncbi:CRISPR/Cas system CSM-associated protein Csm3, group 7 of RAMP superfamily [Frankia canadensis]|uniref:CRISPR/Cas system CSM-associated protein Csm3, group 7 of RAMP superfamily n=1 Tax=Frankia canadensis TaxID=1836972 RepID=A0A2I2L2F2_9ACTN|nr:RAMP superfamily CRISPR-associated protein [Frankia canadensis]SNQ52100.1 CRISPR/Cas system CSM-associated protein Csm3, group 7 of RAMP superfamily [Frankia canadensis]SOU59390.1 CRISPR/Cas system CSM-associated protein Csm3, group 7 of RAMP superfamily [Frankia canadensis]
MAGRPLYTRLRVAGWLRLGTPLHVGGLSLGADVDLTVAVDGQSRLYVPGTSLAGALRSRFVGAADATSADDPTGVADIGETSPRALWGYALSAEPRAGERAGVPAGRGRRITAPEARASRIIVRDALVCATRPADPALPPGAENLLAPARLEVRTSVGIDRHSATAADRILYSRAVVPAGAYLRLEIDVESGTDPDVRTLDRARLAALLDALVSGEVRLGASVSRGLGKVVLDDDVRIVEHDLTSRAGLLAVLRDPSGLGGLGGSARRTLTDLRGAAGQVDVAELITVTIVWTPRAPVMVRADRAGIVADTVPLTGAGGERDDAGKVRLVLPGSSLKGAWRAHAERILRTVAARPVRANATSTPEEFHGQLDDLCLRPAWALFGEPPRPARAADGPYDPAGAPLEASGVPWGRGALRVDDGVSARALDADEWGLLLRGELPSRLRVENLPDDGSRFTRQMLGWLADAGIAQADHVAIDRWTGGAADKLLFSVLEPWRVAWRPLTLTLDVTRLRLLEAESAGAENQDDAAPRWQVGVALLLLLLRDLAAGRIPLGGSVNRGFGDVEVERIGLRWTGHPPGEAARPTGEVTLADLLASDLGAELVDAWRTYHREENGAAA